MIVVQSLVVPIDVRLMFATWRLYISNALLLMEPPINVSLSARVSVSHTMAVHIVKQIPESAERAPMDSQDDPVLLPLDYEESEQIWQMNYKTPEETFLDPARRLLALERPFQI